MRKLHTSTVFCDVCHVAANLSSTKPHGFIGMICANKDCPGQLKQFEKKQSALMRCEYEYSCGRCVLPAGHLDAHVGEQLVAEEVDKALTIADGVTSQYCSVADAAKVLAAEVRRLRETLIAIYPELGK